MRTPNQLRVVGGKPRICPSFHRVAAIRAPHRCYGASGDQRQFDGSRLSVALIRGDCAVGQQQPVALSLRDHEADLVYEESAGIAGVVGLSRALEVVVGNLDRFLEQEWWRIVEPG